MNEDILKILKSLLLQGINEESLQQEVAELQKEFPSHTPYELCNVLIQRTSLSTGVTGGITGAVSWPLTMLLAAPDLVITLILQGRMILKISILAEKDPTDDCRIKELLGCLAASAGAVAGTLGIRKLIDMGISRAFVPFLFKTILQKHFKSLASRSIPFLGPLAGGGLNYGGTMAVGNIARDYYFPITEKIEVTGDGDEDYEDEDEYEEAVYRIVRDDGEEEDGEEEYEEDEFVDGDSEEDFEYDDDDVDDEEDEDYEDESDDESSGGGDKK